MNLNPANQLTLYGHHLEFYNFINLYKNKKLPNKILLSGERYWQIYFSLPYY